MRTKFKNMAVVFNCAEGEALIAGRDGLSGVRKHSNLKGHVSDTPVGHKC